MLKNRDALVVLEEVAASLKESAEQITTSSEFDTGRRMAYYEAISTLLAQCEVAGISQSEIGLDGFIPESLLGDKKQAA
jgi:hypothetical protein